jgi:hypothetical protein
MTSPISYFLTDEWKNVSDPSSDPFYKQIMAELTAARSEKDRALCTFLQDKYLLPETCDAFAAADLRWRDALRALRVYTQNLMQQA